MTLRGASGKFNLPSFGRKSNKSQDYDNSNNSPVQSRVTSSSYGPPHVSTTGGSDSGSLASPRTDTHGGPVGGGSGGGGGFGLSLGGGGGGHHRGGGGAGGVDGLGRKIGKSIAHTSLLPALGNQDLRALQDVINTEKGVVGAADKFAVEMSQAATKLPVYGEQEGPDLHDVLGHSATLLSQLSNALKVFGGHEASMRQCFKRIREREEQLDELRRRRRTTGQKADTAERKLSKMGPENKQLFTQTELLESLRGQMRQLDSDIVNEESKLGDFKRQSVKEAMSFKFGGLEELGEKMCIIGELGKLLLEEIPLEETPPGYGRAPYNSFDRTENTMAEAKKCLATVQFHAGSAEPKPPGLPGIAASDALRPPSLPGNNSHLESPRHSALVAEEYGEYPRDVGSSSPPASRPSQLPALDHSTYQRHQDNLNPQNGRYSEFGADSAPQTNYEPVPPNNSDWRGPDAADLDAAHAYEYQQQREMDEAAAAAAAAEPVPAASEQQEGGWQPLKVARDSQPAASRAPPSAFTLHDGPPADSLYGRDQGARLTVNQDAFAPLSESFLSPDDVPPVPGQRAESATGYFTPDDGERDDAPTPTIPQVTSGIVNIPAATEPTAYHKNRTSSPLPAEAAAAALAYDMGSSPENTPPMVSIPAVPSAPEVPVASYKPPTPPSLAPPGALEPAAPRPMSGYVPPVAPPVPSDDHEDAYVTEPVNIGRESYYLPTRRESAERDSYMSEDNRASMAASERSFGSTGMVSAAAFRRRQAAGRSSMGVMSDMGEDDEEETPPRQHTPSNANSNYQLPGGYAPPVASGNYIPPPTGYRGTTESPGSPLRRLPKPPSVAPAQVPRSPSLHQGEDVLHVPNAPIPTGPPPGYDYGDDLR